MENVVENGKSEAPNKDKTEDKTSGDQEPRNDGKPSIQNDTLMVESPFPVAPDGGYGWVIVCACFVLQFMIDGLFSVFGVFFPQFLSHFGASRGKTAIIGSLLSSCMMLLGESFIQFQLNRYPITT